MISDISDIVFLFYAVFFDNVMPRSKDHKHRACCVSSDRDKRPYTDKAVRQGVSQSFSEGILASLRQSAPNLTALILILCVMLHHQPYDPAWSANLCADSDDDHRIRFPGRFYVLKNQFAFSSLTFRMCTVAVLPCFPRSNSIRPLSSSASFISNS